MQAPITPASFCSISTDGFSDCSDSVPVDCHNLDVVSSVDVSLCDRVDDILGRILDLLLTLGQNLHLEIVTNELIVQNRGSKLRSRTLDTIGQLIIGAYSIIAVNDSFTFLDAAKKVKGVVGHEAATVKRD